MVEISESKDSIVRDLRAWSTGKNQFLEDALNNTISYLRNPLHHTTARAKMGQNPEILSVMRLLVKAFQYDLSIDPNSVADIKKVIAEFEPSKIKNPSALRRMNEIAAKLIMHSSDIERAMNVLDQLGLRKKLLSLDLGEANLWLNKEPLRSFEISTNKKIVDLPQYTSGKLKNSKLIATGKNAKDLGIDVVAHETNSFLAYESITKSHTGEPNVLISRDNTNHEMASFGDGFYTRIGRTGARGTGLNIRFNVDPEAREGVDFTVHSNYIVFLNKKALRVIQESLNVGIVELVEMIESENFTLDTSDSGIIEKLKRRLNADRIGSDLEKLMNSSKKEDQRVFENILTSLISNPKLSGVVAEETVADVAKVVYQRLASLKSSKVESDILKYTQLVSVMLPVLTKNNVLKKSDFQKYLIQKRAQSLSAELASSVAIELALTDGPERFGSRLDLAELDLEAKAIVIKKIKSFEDSLDERKLAVFKILSKEKELALKGDSAKKLQKLMELGFLDVNAVSLSGHSLLLEAAYYDAKNIVDFLLSHRELDLDRKNKQGHNDIEELRLIGKTELADEIESKIGRKKSKRIRVIERLAKKTKTYPDGMPIIDSVRIEPGSFMMGDKEKVKVTLTKAIDIMSVDTTLGMWQGVVDLINTYAPRQFNILERSPTYDRTLESPVVRVSFTQVNEQWLVALNQLSNMKNPEVQKALLALFPGHYLSKRYRLPTEAEWEYVSRRRGLATGDYAFGNSDKEIDDHAWFDENSGRRLKPVGLKKPIMINGKPLYDIHGNVQQLVQDIWDVRQILPGGVDPLVKVGSGPGRVIRGSSWNDNAWGTLGLRDSSADGIGDAYTGFRLAADAQ
jgi:formylglycine-generating enzyme required for sulfatase activity